MCIYFIFPLFIFNMLKLDFYLFDFPKNTLLIIHLIYFTFSNLLHHFENFWSYFWNILLICDEFAAASFSIFLRQPQRPSVEMRFWGCFAASVPHRRKSFSSKTREESKFEKRKREESELKRAACMKHMARPNAESKRPPAVRESRERETEWARG